MNEDIAATLESRVRQALAERPYTVTSVPGGFDVVLDLADAQWWGVLNRAGLRKSISHEVRVDGERYVVTDVEREVEWVAGVPGFSASGTWRRGRIRSVGFQKTYALDDDLRPALVVDYSYSSEEARRVVVAEADALGLRSQRPVEETIAMVVAGLTVVGLLVGGILVLVLWLLGRL